MPKDDPIQRKADITRAYCMFGYKPKIKLKEGLKKTIEYFKIELNDTNTNDRKNDESVSTNETTKESAPKQKERQIRPKTGGFKRFAAENNLAKVKAIQKEQDCQVIDKKEENIHSSSFENEPTQINKESEHIPTQMKYKKSYMRPTLNKSVNFDSYQTEVLHPIPQYRKKIIGQCSFANTPNDDSGSKTNRLLQSQYTKHSLRYEDEEGSTTERIQTPLALTVLKTNNKRSTEDINSFPIKEEEK